MICDTGNGIPTAARRQKDRFVADPSRQIAFNKGPFALFKTRLVTQQIKTLAINIPIIDQGQRAFCASEHRRVYPNHRLAARPHKRVAGRILYRPQCQAGIECKGQRVQCRIMVIVELYLRTGSKRHILVEQGDMKRVVLNLRCGHCCIAILFGEQALAIGQIRLVLRSHMLI